MKTRKQKKRTKKPGEPRRKKPKPKGRGDAKLAAAFGRNLRRIRTDAGLSQHKLARAVKVSAPTVCNIEQGQFSPSLDSLRKLKVGLKISWDVLLKGI
jgi:ribosome-binding protein aMBF1 (putative translation factor)